jgi:predicted AlkP superfamily pyrophosphatase or phosphodiesterase
MLNQKAIDKVQKSIFCQREWRKPCYEDYCFSQISPTISHLLVNNKSENILSKDTLAGLEPNYSCVVLLFLDAFGWNFFHRALEKKLPAVERFVQDGTVSLITSMFPSTTAAHVHTLNTGFPPCQTGIYEWRMYESTIDTVISPLLFSCVEDADGNDKTKRRETLVTKGIAQGKDIFAPSPFYQYLYVNGVTIYDFYPQEFVDGSYNSVVTNLSQRIGYPSLSEGLKTLYQQVSTARKQKENKAFFKFYSPLFDTISHHYGPNSTQLNDALSDFFTLLENEFLAPLSQAHGENVAVLISADHGHIGINPDETIYLDTEMPEIITFFSKTKSGTPIFPCGSRRDLFLHVQTEYLEQLYSKLSDRLEGIARVFYQEEVKELFGNWEQSSRFKNNLGNLLILPLDNKGVFLAGKDGRHRKKNIGEHGGLSSDEMDIPFGVLHF